MVTELQEYVVLVLLLCVRTRQAEPVSQREFITSRPVTTQARRFCTTSHSHPISSQKWNLLAWRKFPGLPWAWLRTSLAGPQPPCALYEVVWSKGNVSRAYRKKAKQAGLSSKELCLYKTKTQSLRPTRGMTRMLSWYKTDDFVLSAIRTDHRKSGDNAEKARLIRLLILSLPRQFAVYNGPRNLK